MDWEVDSEIAVVVVVAIFVDEANTQVKAMKICTQMVERPHLYAFVERLPKCFVDCFGHPVEVVSCLMPH